MSHVSLLCVCGVFMFLSKNLLSKYDCVWLDKRVVVRSACLGEQYRMLTVLIVVFQSRLSH